MIPDAIRQLIHEDRVDTGVLEQALDEIMGGKANPVLISGLMVAMSARPADAQLLAAAAGVLRAHSVPVASDQRPLLDTAGTGGDGSGTFNISTCAALVVAAAGVPVAKHGNRGVSSAVGSADVLEAAGAVLDLGPEECAQLLEEMDFAFLFAQRFHPAMANVAEVRGQLRLRGMFNTLGPLANPADAERQLLGVYDAALTRPVAKALRVLGVESAVVVHCAGLDEIGLHGVTTGHRLKDGQVEPFLLDPNQLGLQPADIAALKGAGTAAENAALMRDVLGGSIGPRADAVAVNAAVALELAGAVGSIAEGLEQSREILASSKALHLLERYAERTRELART